MNDLTTVLRQRILIVYSDIEWRDEMFSKVLDAYPHDMINKMIRSRCGCWIELKDGTMIRFVYASDAARGIRANKIIAQPGIDETFLYTVFRRMLISDSDMYVATDNEINRSWCSSSSANDQRAITIECASGMKEPYEMNNTVYEKLIKLCADICRRNGKTKVVWKGSKSASLAYEPKSNEMVLTAHRFFANKSCPGDWLYSRYSDLANRINALLGSGTTASGGNSNDSTNTSAPSKPNTNFPKVPFTVNVIVSDLNIRKAPNGDIVGKTGKGVFTITSVKNGWGKLKSGAGWIYLANADYCTIGSSVSGTSSKPSTNVSKVPYKVRVDASDLRLRSGAGTNYPTTGEYTGKGTFTIIEEKAGTGSTKGWGKLKSGAGWISLDYCVKL